MFNPALPVAWLTGVRSSGLLVPESFERRTCEKLKARIEINAVCPTRGQSRARKGAGPRAPARGSAWLVARVCERKGLSLER